MSPTAHPLDDFSKQVAACAKSLAEDSCGAAGSLCDLTSQRLVRLAITITRSQHDAEDAVQASLVRVSLSPELLLSAQQPWHYLLQMVRNQALQILRKRKHTQTLSGTYEMLTYCPVNQLEQRETYQAVWRALAKLPAEQSEIVVLKIWEQMTFQQIAVTLSLPLATVASRYRYALEKLAVYLRASSGELIHE